MTVFSFPSSAYFVVGGSVEGELGFRERKVWDVCSPGQSFRGSHPAEGEGEGQPAGSHVTWLSDL